MAQPVELKKGRRRETLKPYVMGTKDFKETVIKPMVTGLDNIIALAQAVTVLEGYPKGARFRITKTDGTTFFVGKGYLKKARAAYAAKLNDLSHYHAAAKMRTPKPVKTEVVNGVEVEVKRKTGFMQPKYVDYVLRGFFMDPECNTGFITYNTPASGRLIDALRLLREPPANMPAGRRGGGPGQEDGITSSVILTRLLTVYVALNGITLANLIAQIRSVLGANEAAALADINVFSNIVTQGAQQGRIHRRVLSEPALIQTAFSAMKSGEKVGGYLFADDIIWKWFRNDIEALEQQDLANPRYKKNTNTQLPPFNRNMFKRSDLSRIVARHSRKKADLTEEEIAFIRPTPPPAPGQPAVAENPIVTEIDREDEVTRRTLDTYPPSETQRKKGEKRTG